MDNSIIDLGRVANLLALSTYKPELQQLKVRLSSSRLSPWVTRFIILGAEMHRVWEVNPIPDMRPAEAGYGIEPMIMGFRVRILTSRVEVAGITRLLRP